MKTLTINGDGQNGQQCIIKDFVQKGKILKHGRIQSKYLKKKILFSLMKKNIEKII